jgi:hypothetical protein
MNYLESSKMAVRMANLMTDSRTKAIQTTANKMMGFQMTASSTMDLSRTASSTTGKHC